VATLYDEYAQAVRGGLGAEPITGAVLTPIFQSTTFVRQTVDQEPAFSYSRSANPTVAALEQNLAAQEGTSHARAFSTGMAALTTLCLAHLRAGDRVVAADVVYGGTFRLFREILAPFGVACDFIDTSKLDEVVAALESPARLLIVETPANPTLKVTDIQACADIARQRGVTLVVDNTFLTPVLQRPVEHGADVVLYSTTKYQDGHNAAMGGAICTNDGELTERLHYVRQAIGTIQTPFNAWLTLQGLKTLPLRMARHTESAAEVARFLEAHPRVRTVHYPGLESSPYRKVVQRQQRGGGGIVSFEVDGGLEATRAFLNATGVIDVAENLGAVETLLTHPATMTHASVPAETRNALGITDGLVRLSVGLEGTRTIVADLAQALDCEVAA
jgi:cystathionine beta-lyase/cystathionine gamma-synthase